VARERGRRLSPVQPRAGAPVACAVGRRVPAPRVASRRHARVPRPRRARQGDRRARWAATGPPVHCARTTEAGPALTRPRDLGWVASGLCAASRWGMMDQRWRSDSNRVVLSRLLAVERGKPRVMEAFPFGVSRRSLHSDGSATSVRAGGLMDRSHLRPWNPGAASGLHSRRSALGWYQCWWCSERDFMIFPCPPPHQGACLAATSSGFRALGQCLAVMHPQAGDSLLRRASPHPGGRGAGTRDRPARIIGSRRGSRRIGARSWT
jgi:hypothetical protein